MKLIACWMRTDELGIDEPYCVYWADGTPATVDDYRNHQTDTHEILMGFQDRVELHMYPDVVAGVRFDRERGAWRVSGKGIPAFYLEIEDPDISDELLKAELFTYPIVYKAEILRSRRLLLPTPHLPSN